MITLDFETRSRCDIRKAGTYKYSVDPTSEPICLGWAFDGDDEVYLWHPEFPLAGLAEERPLELDELFARIADGEEVEAHNAMMERCFWTNVMVPRYGWPAVPETAWRCSAAKAATHALQRKLEQAVKNLGLPVEKDMPGNRVMLKLSKPRKALKRDRKAVADALGIALDAVPAHSKQDVFSLREWVQATHGGRALSAELLAGPLYPWHETQEELHRVFEYNKDDVRAEMALSAELRDIEGVELETWRLDQRMNERGVHCDRVMVERALDLAAEATRRANREMVAATGGAVRSTGQVAKVVEWLNAEGCPVPNLQQATIEAFLQDPSLDEAHRAVLEARKTASRTSTKKYAAMLARLCDDDRIRDLLAYHGASTGRWAGRGIQPQNFPRGMVKESMDRLCADILSMDYDDLEMLYGDVMEALATALRGALCAPEGYDLVAGDYSAIEARGTFWISGHVEGLRRFKYVDSLGRGAQEDIYTLQASDILGRKVWKKDAEDRQKWGKVPVLGCGYQMGAGKLVTYAGQMGTEIDEETAKRIVDGYRESNRPVVEFWYEVEAAALSAVSMGRGAKPVRCRSTLWAVRDRFLHCKLPSGRLLSYLDPKIAPVETPWGDLRDAVTFMGVDTYTQQWKRCSTYGGKLTENVVQALCRDIMRDAMLRLDAHPSYTPILTVHDEVVSEAREGEGSVGEYESIMAVVPEWAPGFPVAAEAWRGKRYRK